MRHLLLTTAALAAFAGIPAFAADEDGHGKDHTKTEAGKEAKAVNKVDPTTGKEVDAKVDTLELKYEKKAVIVGFSSKESLEAATKADEAGKEMIAHAAKTHKLIKDGKLVEMEKSEKHDKHDK